MMLIAEHIGDDGARERTYLAAGDDRIVLSDDDGALGALAPAAIVAVMRRYGKPLDPAVLADRPPGSAEQALPLGEGLRLERLRYHAWVDADGRDYLVLCGEGEPLAALSVSIASALRFLVRGPTR